MARHKKASNSRKQTAAGAGGFLSKVINKAVDLLPFEAHLPGYNYCGPGTDLDRRLKRGDKGINGLDEACKLHDIEYSKYSDTERRRQADKDLAERAWQRFKASDSSIGEKAASWAVTTAMKAKSALGRGKKRRGRDDKKKKGKGLYLRPYPKRGGGSKKSTPKRYVGVKKKR